MHLEPNPHREVAQEEEKGIDATTPDTTTSPVAFHVMTKPRGAICNLDCEYCYFLAKGGRPKSGFELLKGRPLSIIGSRN